LHHFCLAAALAHLGRLDEARSAVQAGLTLNQTFTFLRFRAGTPGDNPTFLAQRERIYEACARPRCLRGEREAEISAILNGWAIAYHRPLQPLALTVPLRLNLSKGMGPTISTERL
jgi:hypothetical protein